MQLHVWTVEATCTSCKFNIHSCTLHNAIEFGIISICSNGSYTHCGGCTPRTSLAHTQKSYVKLYTDMGYHTYIVYRPCVGYVYIGYSIICDYTASMECACRASALSACDVHVLIMYIHCRFLYTQAGFLLGKPHTHIHVNE